MTKPHLSTLINQAIRSQNAADRYREMATHLRRLDPTYSDPIVNEEVGRLGNLAGEMADDAEDNRELALELYGIENVDRMLCAHAL